MARKQRQFTAQFKSETVMDMLRGEKRIAQICRERQLTNLLVAIPRYKGSATIGMMQQFGGRTLLHHRHIQCLFDQLGAHMIRHRQSNNLACSQIQHGSQVQISLVGLDVSDVAQPHPTTLLYIKLAIEQIG